MKSRTSLARTVSGQRALRPTSEAEIVQGVPLYSGERSLCVFKTFVRRLGQQFCRFGVSADDRRIALTKTRLGGRAASWACKESDDEPQSQDNSTTWSDFMLRLESRFVPGSSAYRKVAELHSFNMANEDSAASYGAKFENRMRELGLDTCPDAKLHTYLKTVYTRGLSPELRGLIRRWERQHPFSFVRLRDLVDTVNALERKS